MSNESPQNENWSEWTPLWTPDKETIVKWGDDLERIKDSVERNPRYGLQCLYNFFSNMRELGINKDMGLEKQTARVCSKSAIDELASMQKLYKKGETMFNPFPVMHHPVGRENLSGWNDDTHKQLEAFKNKSAENESAYLDPDEFSEKCMLDFRKLLDSLSGDPIMDIDVKVEYVHLYDKALELFGEIKTKF